MKWIKDIKTNTQSWLAFLSGFVATATDEPDDTAIINEYFATYLQKIAADRIKPVSCEAEQPYQKPDTSEAHSKHPEKSFLTLSPIKQIL